MNASRDHRLQPVDIDELPIYPLSREDRLDSHYFMVWERRRWLNSDMRLKGTPEARALYFDLINISYEQSPAGTLPDDLDLLAKLLFTDVGHFRALARMDFGPLHKWTRCLCDGEEVRLFHPMVLRTLTDAISRKEDNRARTDAANSKKRRQRLREVIAGYHVELSKNDAAILWMDDWLSDKTGYRNAAWAERAVAAWSDHALRLGVSRRGQTQ